MVDWLIKEDNKKTRRTNIFELRMHQALSYKEIADIYMQKLGEKISPDMIRCAIERERVDKQVPYNEVEKSINKILLRRIDSVYKDIVEHKEQLFAEHNKPSNIGLPKHITKKILTISDLHEPFGIDEMVDKALKDHKDADILVLAGDLFDQQAFSTYHKYRNIAFYQEYMLVSKFVKKCSDLFPEVYVLSGNHDDRFARLVRDRISGEAIHILNLDILGKICNGEIYDETWKLIGQESLPNVYYRNGVDNWWCQIGKTIICHPTQFSNNYQGAFTHFNSKGLQFDSLFIAHTHQASKKVWNGCLVVETGCMCLPLDYAKASSLRYDAQCNGYGVIYQDKDGSTDFNLSGFTYCGMREYI